MSILIKDNQTGNIREYGTNGHDALHISPDGSCLRYENMQNGDGSLGGGYSFVMEDGKIPKESETADAIHGMCYFNVGGFRTEPVYVPVANIKFDKEDLSEMVEAAIVRCKDCIHRDPEDKKCDCGKMERVGNSFAVHDDYFCAYGERQEAEE